MGVLMKIRTVKDLGAAVRDQRRRLGIDQTNLANKVGTSRQWIIHLEAGKPTLPMNMVLRALKTLGLEIDLTEASTINRTGSSDGSDVDAIDINAIIDRAKSN